MKKCPICDKSYDDSLRFCQSDGSALIETADSSASVSPAAPDKDEFSTAEPVDPFKTMVAAPTQMRPIEERSSGEEDMMHTIVAPPPESPSPFSKPSAPLVGGGNPQESRLSGDGGERIEVTFGAESGWGEPPTVMAPPPNFINTLPESAAPLTGEGEPWSPPPAPVASWEAGGLGSGTPFQAPPAEGGNKTLAIVSLVLGILGAPVCCGVFAAVPAIVVGVIAKSRIKSDPAVYGGAGLATAGIILGAIATLITVAAGVFYVFMAIADMR